MPAEHKADASALCQQDDAVSMLLGVTDSSYRDLFGVISEKTCLNVLQRSETRTSKSTPCW